MRSKRGFTLIEVLVALAVAAVAISMFAYFVDSLRLTRVSKLETAAAAYARNYLDTVHSQWRWDTAASYRNIALAADLPELPPGYRVQVEVRDRAGNLLLTAPGGPTPAQDRSSLRTVTIRLTDSEDRVLSLTTQIALPPPQ